MRNFEAMTVCLSLMVVPGAGAFAQPAGGVQGGPMPRPSENIALGAAYTVDPQPNYKYCTDPDDAKQLTDGIYSEGHFWTQTSTVGWQNSQPVIITLDLGRDQALRGISYRTAAGAAGVKWPIAVYVFVAGEDHRFREAGDLVTLSAARGLPADDQYATFRYWTDGLQTHGRYVAVAIWQQPFIFCDEIEVYAGDPVWLETPPVGDAVGDIKAFMERITVREAVKRRLRLDVQALRVKAEQESTDKHARDAVLAELTAIERDYPDLSSDYGEDFRAVLPLNTLHERIFRVQARLWQAAGCAPITVWSANPWAPLSHLADPPQGETASIHIPMMPNEYRAGAFNVSNAGQKTAMVTIKLAGLPGGDNPAYITVHEVAWTDTSAGLPVAAALPEARREADAYQISVPSGMTRQVWLTFHPVELAAGTYSGEIQLQTDETELRVPVALQIYPLRFPDKPRLHFGGWDYTNVIGHYEVTEQNRAKLIAHLREHFVDSPWATPAVLPHGEYDATGTMVKEPDTGNFDGWLELWPGAAQYLVFASVSSSFGSWAMGTPEFEKAVKAWVTFWARHAETKGVKPEQLGLLLVDEPHERAQDEVIMAWAKAIHQANTGIRVWEDPTYHDIADAHPEMIAECDVLCPNRPIFLRATPSGREYYAQQQKRGAALEFYSCSGPVRLLDPYCYFRLQKWDCWRYGARASYFWAFADAAGASSWNEYATKRNAYTPLFIDNETVIAGKHLEACREGIEDYEYLAMLHDKVNAAVAQGRTGAEIGQARALLQELPEQVCDAGKSPMFRWKNEEIDRTIADQARIRILDTLVRLGE